MKAWLAYAAVSLAVAGTLGLLGGLVWAGAAARAVWVSAGLAWLLQLAAFGMLLVARREPRLFLAGWAGGIVLRFAGLAALAWWASRTEVLPLDVALVSLVAIIFVLLLLEPLFLRRATTVTRT